MQIKRFAILTLGALTLSAFAQMSFAYREKTTQFNLSSGRMADSVTLTLPAKKMTPLMRMVLRNRVSALEEQADLPRGDQHIVDLGLNNVPIKNQGLHGSCATFATTTAVDAALFQTDHISELCILQALRKGRNKNKKNPMGWEGADPFDISNFILRYGVISKSSQRQIKCGGLSEYPTYSADIGSPMLLRKYTQNSQSIAKLMSFKTVYRFDEKHPDKSFKARATLVQDLKNQLNKGHRLIVGLGMVPTFNNGFVGTYRKPYDTWIVTYDLIKKLQSENIEEIEVFGHGVVIYGYDDSAQVDGQRGVFFIRNSWGGLANSNNFVTYDYVQLLLGEAIAVDAKTDVAADIKAH